MISASVPFSRMASTAAVTFAVSGAYGGRTRHVHVKVYATPTARPLTTQLYFPNEPGNARDGIFNPRLVMDLQQTPAGQLGQYNFVMGG